MTTKANQKFLEQLEQEATAELKSAKAKNAIWKALGELYLAWSEQGPAAFYTQMKLEVLMRLFDDWANR